MLMIEAEMAERCQRSQREYDADDEESADRGTHAGAGGMLVDQCHRRRSDGCDGPHVAGSNAGEQQVLLRRLNRPTSDADAHGRQYQDGEKDRESGLRHQRHRIAGQE